MSLSWEPSKKALTWSKCRRFVILKDRWDVTIALWDGGIFERGRHEAYHLWFQPEDPSRELVGIYGTLRDAKSAAKGKVAL